jgi:hypothetical protein
MDLPGEGCDVTGEASDECLVEEAKIEKGVVADDDRRAVLQPGLGGLQLASGFVESGLAGFRVAKDLRVDFIGEVAAHDGLDDISNAVISTTSLHGFLDNGLLP